MNKIKILHTADVHLTQSSGSDGSSVFARIIELAKQHNVDILLIAGDLFDKVMENLSEKSFVVAMFEQIPNISVFIAAGNHDYLSCYNGVTLPSNVHLFSNKAEKVECKGVLVHGISLDSSVTDTSLINDFKADKSDNVNILLMHGDLAHSSRYNPITEAQIAATGFDYVALGHQHQYGGVKKAGCVYYAYAGVPQSRGFDEIGDKGVLIGEVGKGFADLQFVKTSIRNYEIIEVDISGAKGYNDILPVIRAKACEPSNAYRVNLVGCFESEFDLNVSYLESALSEYYMMQIIDNTKRRIDLEEIANDYTLKGIFAQLALENELDEHTVSIALDALEGREIKLAPPSNY